MIITVFGFLNSPPFFPWYFADVLPTVVDMLDGENPDGIDGVSVLPTLLGEEQDLSDRFLYWGTSGEGPGDVKSGAVRLGKWKAVIKDNEMSLYDLDTDIAEVLDLAAKYPEVLERVRVFLKESVVPAN